MKMLWFTFSLALALLGGRLYAQESSEAALQGFYLIPLSGGQLEVVDAEAGRYTLLIEGVPPALEWVISAPLPFAGRYSTAVLTEEWAADAEDPLYTIGLLQLGDKTIRLVLSEPIYDAAQDQLSVRVDALEVFQLLADPTLKNTAIPEQFGTGMLALVLDDAFEDGLRRGALLLSDRRISRSTQMGRRPGPPRQQRPPRP